MSYLNCGKQYVFGGLIQQNPLEEMEGSPKKGKLRLSRGNLRIGGVGPPHQPSPVQDPLGGGDTPKNREVQGHFPKKNPISSHRNP